MKNNSGFTLIELSIVLVIIGLIVGGVLVGRDLIKAAEIRATISQLEKYNTATNTFRNKYNYLPGDILSSQASAFGLYNVTGANANALAYGNGDGILQPENDGGYTEGYSGEFAMFFLHLSQAGLVDGMYGAGGADTHLNGATTTGGSYNGGIGYPQATATATTTTMIAELLPPAKMGKGNFFMALSDYSTNYFALVGMSNISGAGSSAIVSVNNITPLEAYNIDKKIDDGYPATGRVFAFNANTANITGQSIVVATTNGCVVFPLTNNYNVGDPNFNNKGECALRFNFQ